MFSLQNFKHFKAAFGIINFFIMRRKRVNKRVENALKSDENTSTTRFSALKTCFFKTWVMIRS